MSQVLAHPTLIHQANALQAETIAEQQRVITDLRGELKIRENREAKRRRVQLALLVSLFTEAKDLVVEVGDEQYLLFSLIEQVDDQPGSLAVAINDVLRSGEYPRHLCPNCREVICQGCNGTSFDDLHVVPESVEKARGEK